MEENNRSGVEGRDASLEAGKWKEEVRQKQPIRSYQDLDVYKRTYQAAIQVLLKVLPKLPKEEKFDLVDQLRRSVKAIPRLIAEGYAKRHQPKGFKKYLDDAMAEVNETSVGLSQCKDVYFKFVDPQLCEKLIDNYNLAGKQLYRLGEAWQNFRKR